MEIIRNPYDNRKPVTNPSAFYGRSNDIAKIARRMDSEICSIYGEPRIGKTSLLYFLAHLDGARKRAETRQYFSNLRDTLFVLIELQKLPTRNAFSLWRYIFDRTAEEARNTGRESSELQSLYQDCRK